MRKEKRIHFRIWAPLSASNADLVHFCSYFGPLISKDKGKTEEETVR